MSEQSPLVAVHDVSKVYAVRTSGWLGLGRKRALHALDGVSLSIGLGEVLGLVGESGSGKSTIGRIIVGLEQPTSGKVVFSPASRSSASEPDQPRLAAQIVFQNPAASLNPRQRVRDIIAEPIRVHGMSRDVDAAVLHLIERVGLPKDLLSRRPHALSGGQCQRVGIARALAVNPMLLVCDEPVSALDVSIQAQVLNLLADLQEETNCSYLFISHDLPIVERLSHRIAIMYLGRIIETAPTQALFANPNHPYTRALIDSAPNIDNRRRFQPILGEIPSPLSPPQGCHFHPRCPFAMPRCRVDRPEMQEISQGHFSACHLNQ